LFQSIPRYGRTFAPVPAVLPALAQVQVAQARVSTIVRYSEEVNMSTPEKYTVIGDLSVGELTRYVTEGIRE
jgi:hypothetical protein